MIFETEQYSEICLVFYVQSSEDVLDNGDFFLYFLKRLLKEIFCLDYLCCKRIRSSCFKVCKLAAFTPKCAYFRL